MEIGVFSAGGESGTRFGYVWEFAMAYDAGLGIVAVQLLQEFVESMLLLWSASIGSLSTSANAAFVAYAERAAVVASGVGSADCLRQGGDDVAIAAHIPVVTGLAEFCFASCNEIVYRKITVAPSGGAVNYDEFYCVVI